MNDEDDSIPTAWEYATLGDITVARVEQANPHAPLTYVDIGSIDNETKQIKDPKVLRNGDKIPSRARQIIANGDVLVSMTRPNLNAVAIVPPELKGTIGSTGFDVLRAIEVEPSWIFSIVRSKRFVDSMTAVVQGALYPAVRPIDVRSFQVPIPPLAEQRRIVAKIEALQERSRKARAALAEVGPLLEQFRQSLLAAAFRGDLTADWRAAHPDVEPASELLVRIRKVRREKWEQSELAKYEAKGKTPPKGWQEKYQEPTPLSEYELKYLPALPDSWCWASVMEIHSAIDPLCYGVVQPGPEVADGAKLVRICDIERGRIVTNQLRTIERDIHNAYFRSQLKGREVLVSVVGTIGRVAITDEAVVGANIARAIARITPVPEIQPEWIASVITTPRAADWLNRGSREVARKTLNLKVLERLAVPVAPKVEMDKIIALVRGSTQTIQHTELVKSQSEIDLSQLDQSILAKAFRGELVPQDPADEPAAVLLERIRQQREAQAAAQNGKPKRRARRKEA